MQQKKQHRGTLISIVGPTAVGKTSLSIALARHWKTDIVNCDARQVYRKLDIGTAKPDKEELAAAKHHLIDILEPEDPYNAQQYAEDATKVIENIFSQNPIAIAVGGSTLYAQTLWYGMDDMPEIDLKQREALQKEFNIGGLASLQKELAAADPATWKSIDQKNHARIIRALEVYRSTGKPISSFRTGKRTERPWNNIKVCLNLEPRDLLYERINRRVDIMMEQGLVQEIKALLEKGLSPEAPGLNSIGYRELLPYFSGESSLDEAVDLIKRNSRRYAKRQLTWWRREAEIHWLDASKDHDNLVQEVISLI